MKLKHILAAALLTALAACTTNGFQGEIPDPVRAHLRQHPGDIRFNRPKIVWTVEKEFPQKAHVLPDAVYLQLYKDKFDQAWDDMKLDQGTGKAYDVIVEVPILHYFPGTPDAYTAAGVGAWAYRVRIVDPATGQVIARWKAGTDSEWYSPFWGKYSGTAAPCAELGHWAVIGSAVLGVATPLYFVKSGRYDSFGAVIDEYEYGTRAVLNGNKASELYREHRDAYRHFLMGLKPPKLGVGGGYITMAETQAAARKVGYEIHFPSSCHDHWVYLYVKPEEAQGMELHLPPPEEGEKWTGIDPATGEGEDKYKPDL